MQILPLPPIQSGHNVVPKLLQTPYFVRRSESAPGTRSFEEILAVYGLTNQVEFLCTSLVNSPDPVISDFPGSLVLCHSLGTVGSSYYFAILTTIGNSAVRNETLMRTDWFWERGDWNGFRNELDSIIWTDVLQGDVDKQVETLSNLLLSLHRRFIPCQTYKFKAKDQP